MAAVADRGAANRIDQYDGPDLVAGGRKATGRAEAAFQVCGGAAIAAAMGAKGKDSFAG